MCIVKTIADHLLQPQVVEDMKEEDMIVDTIEAIVTGVVEDEANKWLNTLCLVS